MRGLSGEMALEMAKNLEFKGATVSTAADQIQRLYNLFLSVDATQVEINPFGETPDGRGESFSCTPCVSILHLSGLL